MTVFQKVQDITSDGGTPRPDDVHNATREEPVLNMNRAADNDAGGLKPQGRSQADKLSHENIKRWLCSMPTKIATWNVRTMTHDKLPILTRELH